MGLGVQPIKRQAKDFTEAEKAAIVYECTVELCSPILLAEKCNVNITSIRGWIKAAGKTLPQKYKFNATKHQRKLLTPSSVQVILRQINMFCHQLTQNMTTDFVRFTKLYTNCSNLQNLCFDFENNLCKSL